MPGASGDFIKVQVDTHELSALFAAAKAAEGSIQVELRRGIKAAAEPVRMGVQAAAGFSSRIPGGVKVKASFPKKGAGVTVYVDPKTAPEAAPLNNKDRGGSFRHPVHGNTDVWVDQKAQPFMAVGARSGMSSADTAMLAVMDRIAATLGFH
jgi:hypothetical protein